MRQKRLLTLLAVGLLSAALETSVGAQKPASSSAPTSRPAPVRTSGTRHETTGAQTGASDAAMAANLANLTDAQKSMVEGSRRAIISTGIGEAYFRRHFRPVQVIDKPGDTRVVWKFSFGEYEATINDSLGYYTEGGRRIYTHSVTNILNSTSEIRRTIPRRTAERLMRRCIGRFTKPSVEYRPVNLHGPAALVLTAQSLAPSRRREAREEREEEGRPTFVGAINLETGQCTKNRTMTTP